MGGSQRTQYVVEHPLVCLKGMKKAAESMVVLVYSVS